MRRLSASRARARTILDLIELGLAVWRVSYMLVHEEGPNDVFIKLREASGVQYDDKTGETVSWNDWTPLICIWCTSLYVAVILSWAPKRLITMFATSGIAVIVDKLVSKNKPATYIINESGSSPSYEVA